MNNTVVFITLAIALPITAVVAWIWITVEQIDKDFSAGLEGIHFEV